MESQIPREIYWDIPLRIRPKRSEFPNKSLDDYFLQLKFGKKLGFDFEKHKNEKVGVLRKYVKKNKSSLK